jgi:2-phosphosulfolactate phosphatase
MSVFEQAGYQVRFEWGEHGARALASACDVLVIVDVLSFSTAVDVAVSHGATVLPFGVRDPVAAAVFAMQERAELAVARRQISDEHPYSLSPRTFTSLAPGTRVVLPSPNGSSLSLLASEHGCHVFAGCLRNASAVATAALDSGSIIGVVAAGERWPDGSLRPAIEDLLGAGAIIQRLRDRRASPEAWLAATAFAGTEDLTSTLENCASGRELVEMGFPEDVAMAALLDVSAMAPSLNNGSFSAYTRTA